MKVQMGPDFIRQKVKQGMFYLNKQTKSIPALAGLLPAGGMLLCLTEPRRQLFSLLVQGDLVTRQNKAAIKPALIACFLRVGLGDPSGRNKLMIP